MYSRSQSNFIIYTLTTYVYTPLHDKALHCHVQLFTTYLCIHADQLLTLTSGGLPGPHRFHTRTDTLPAHIPV